MKQVLQHFDSVDIISLDTAKQLFNDVKLRMILPTVNAIFCIYALPLNLWRNLSNSQDNLNIVHSVVNSLENLQERVVAAVKNKLSFLKGNLEFKTSE